MNQQFSQNLTQFSDFIIDSNEVGIIIGSHQNLDTVAAALALFLSLRNSGKNAQIISLKEPTVEISSLVGVDKIKKSFTGNTTKLVVALPYIKGEVEKVLFTEQPDTINFHLTAAPNRTITPFDLNKVKLNWEGGAPKNIISVGVGNQNELSDVIDVENYRIVNIDNYQNNSRFGEIVLVDETFSSLSEIVGKIIKDERLPFDQDAAQNVLDGVLFATRNFTKGNTSPFAFEAASNAMYQGAQRKSEAQIPQNQPRQQVSQPQMDQGRQQFGQGNPRPYDVAPFGDTQGRPFGDTQGRPFGDAQGKRPSQNQGQRNQFDQRQNPRQNQGNQRRDNRQNPSFGGQSNQFGQNRNQGQRVNPNDFPAMHIQDIRNQIQNDARMQNQRNNQQRFNQPPFDPSQGRQNDRNQDKSFGNAPFDSSFGNAQDRQIREDKAINPMPEDIFDPRDQVNSSDMSQNNPQSSFDSVQNTQNDFAPKQGMQAPPVTETEPQNYENINDEDVPDDWLMPKVFKSSKNNN